MRLSGECATARRAWMAAFDECERPAASVADHVRECSECQDFAAATEAARRALATLPLPEPDFEADAALLAALNDHRPWWRRAAPALAAALRPAPPLAAVAAAACAATLGVALLLGTPWLADRSPLAARLERMPRAVPAVIAPVGKPAPPVPSASEGEGSTVGERFLRSSPPAPLQPKNRVGDP